MRLHRFYVQQPLGEEVVIDDVSIITQWVKVLRYESGDTVVLFNGDGFDYTFEFIDISRKSCKLQKTKSVASLLPKHKSYLFLAIIKKDLFELVLEKATELGVTDIIPIITERTGKKNLDFRRLEMTVKEAAEQSGRGDVPVIHGEETLSGAILKAKQLTENTCYVATLYGKPFSLTVKPTEAYSMFVGPEGGWSPNEEQIFRENETILVSLGKTTLRAETAAIAFMALLALE